MNRRTLTKTALLAAFTIATLGWTRAALGPPWVSIEYPPSPYDATTREAFLLVHAFHHGTPMDFPVSGTAEGIVKGERRSVKLDFAKTSRTGVYALRKKWQSDGTWTLVIGVTQGAGEGNTVSAIVDLAANGAVAQVRVPTSQRDGWAIPQRVSMQEVEASLRVRAGAGVAGR